MLYVSAESKEQVQAWLKTTRISLFHSKSTAVVHSIEQTAFAPDIKDHVLEAP